MSLCLGEATGPGRDEARPCLPCAPLSRAQHLPLVIVRGGPHGPPVVGKQHLPLLSHS